MAAQTSPTLTSTSHTLTAAPGSKMAPPSASAAGDEAAATLLASLDPAKRHTFLRPSAAIPTESLNVVKRTLEGFAAQVGEQQELRLKESRKRKRRGVADDALGKVLKLRKLYVDGFKTEQVWQQAKRIIAGVLSFSDVLLQELEDKQELAPSGGDAVESGSEEEKDGGAEISLDSREDESEEDGGAQSMSGEDLEDEPQDQNEDESPGDGQDDCEEGDEEEDGEGPEGDDEYVQDAHGLNDGFFSIDNFNKQTQLLEEQDARGDSTTDQAGDDENIDWDADPFAPAKTSTRKSGPHSDGATDDDDEDDEDQGPTFGNMSLDAPEGDSEDEAMDDGAPDDLGEFNANEIYYKDFFAPPPKRSRNDKPKPKKSVKFATQQPAEADVERAMADVRRDLFDDESEEEDSEDALSDVSAGDPRSRRSAHERRQAKLAEEIRQLEAASVAKREWTLSGEAAAADRPMNSLLEEDLDFEHGGKPVPVITPEVTEDIEELIKRRILAQEFDEVLRRRPDTEGVPAGTRRGMAELDDTKSGKGLAELYEEEHVKKANPDGHVSQADEKLAREEKEVEALWKDVCARLDALSSWHYKPKPATAALSVVADVATISMEEAQPGTAQGVAGASSRMAPQEVYRAGGDGPGAAAAAGGEVSTRGGLPVARGEMSREERTRRRRRAKERARKAGGAPAGESARAKSRRETMTELKHGGVRVINRKGEVTDIDGNKAKAAKSLSGGGLKL